jgi:Four helix bundle sensory module for signal transduction
MIFLTGAVSRLSNIRLHVKLMLAFIILAVLIGVSGGSGLIFVQRIGETVAVFSEVASPLLEQSTALADGARKAHVALLGALSRTDHGELAQFQREIAELNAAARTELEALRQLVQREKLDLDLKEAAAQQQEFMRQAEAALQVHVTRLKNEALALERLRQFEAERQALDVILGNFARHSEVVMSGHEDAAKTMVQSSAATVDDLDNILSETFNQSYPVLLAAYKSMRGLMQLQDTARCYVNERDRTKLTQISEGALASIKSVNSQLKRVGGRLNDNDGKQVYARILQGFSTLEAVLLGNDGLFAAYDESLAAQAQAESLTRKETRCFRLLRGVG